MESISRRHLSRWWVIAFAIALVACDDEASSDPPAPEGGLRDAMTDVIATGDALAEPECIHGDERACAAEIDPCGTGTQRCFEGLWLECEGNAVPDEICNGVDDDCDERIDEPVGRSCKAEDDAPGRWACDPESMEVVCIECTVDGDDDGSGFCDDCDDGDPAARPGAAEICDGADNDCDRIADEGFDVGGPCTVGEGACANDGLLMCVDDGTAACDAEAGAPVLEACNGADDDCDGRVDEGYALGEPCFEGIGACMVEGRTICHPGGEEVGCDATPAPPGEEVCDRDDNDCDGRIDEVSVDAFGDPENCGRCGNVCPGPGPICFEAACYRTYWVDATEGSDAMGLGTEEAPWRTITHAVATAEGPRARIMIRPGTYGPDMDPQEFEQFPVRLWDGIQLIGTGEGIDAAAAVRIEGVGPGFFIWEDAVEQPNRAERLTFTGRGGAFLVDNSRVVLRDIHVEDSVTQAAAGGFEGTSLVVGKRDADIELIDGRVERVLLGGHCAVRFENSTAVIRRTSFINNTGGNAQGQLDGQVCNASSDVTVINSTFADNTAHGVLAVTVESRTSVIHSTFTDQTGIAIYALHGELLVANSLIAHSQRYGVYAEVRVPGENIRLQSNLFWDNADGHYSYRAGDVLAETAEAVDAIEHAAGSVEGEPDFFSRIAHNVRLRGDSAANGMAADAFREPIDQDRQPRGEPADIGAYETAN